jgi:hypothetical protein
MFSRNIDLVTGAPAFPPCSVLREDADVGQPQRPCGIQGKLFEPRVGTLKSALSNGVVSGILDELGNPAGSN